jgi:hypothetical protein
MNDNTTPKETEQYNFLTIAADKGKGFSAHQLVSNALSDNTTVTAQ